MSDRGEYRSFFVSILDDLDFQAMEPLVFKLLFALKMSLGPAGIGILRKLDLVEKLGCSLDELESFSGRPRDAETRRSARMDPPREEHRVAHKRAAPRAFYAGATPERRAKVLSELAAALSPKGVRVRGNDFARAKDRAHLDRCIARTIADEIRIPDRAIVVLMKKLQDEEKDDRGRYPGEANVERDKAVIAKENAYDRARRAAANDWSKDNPDELARLQKTARLNCPAEGQLGDIARNSWLLQEISKRNGFPDYETWLSGQVPMAATA
jgi:hypothetical protein